MARYLTRSLALAVCEQIEAAYRDQEKTDKVPVIFTAKQYTRGLSSSFLKAVVQESGSSISQLKDNGIVKETCVPGGEGGGHYGLPLRDDGYDYEVDLRKLRQVAGLPVSRGVKFF